MCFIPTEKVPVKYAAGLPCGATLGYELDRNIRRAHSAVGKAIKAKRDLLLLAADGDYSRLRLANSHEFHGSQNINWRMAYF